jgi:hypothetical protein
MLIVIHADGTEEVSEVKGDHLGAVTEELLEGPYPELGLRYVEPDGDS